MDEYRSGQHLRRHEARRPRGVDHGARYGGSENPAEDQLAAARDEPKDTRYALWDKVKRARSGAKAKHGDNSGEYERFGGTRISERQRRTPAPEAPLVL